MSELEMNHENALRAVEVLKEKVARLKGELVSGREAEEATRRERDEVVAASKEEAERAKEEAEMARRDLEEANEDLEAQKASGQKLLERMTK